MSQRGARKRAIRAEYNRRVKLQSASEFYMTLGGRLRLRSQPKFFNQREVDARHARLGRDWV